MGTDDINPADSPSTPLGTRLQRNLREIIVAVVLTLAAVAVLIARYGA